MTMFGAAGGGAGVPGREGLPLRILLGLALVVVMVAGMRAASDLLNQLLLASFLAIITTPIFLWLRDRRVPAVAAMGLMMTLLMVGVTGLVYLLADTIRGVNADLPAYQAALELRLDALVTWLDDVGVTVDRDALSGLFGSASIMGVVGDGLRLAGYVMNKTFVVVLLTIFIWAEAAVMPTKVESLVNQDTWRAIRVAVDNVRRYMLLKTGMSAMTGCAVWLLAVGVGLPYAATLGLLAFVLNYIPVIGSLIAALPGVALAVLEWNVMWGLVVAGGYLVINVGIGNILEPRFFGRGLGISPLVVLLSMICWGWVLGPIGMFLSVPLTMVVKLAAETHPDSMWMAVLLAGGSPERIRHTLRMQRIDG